MKKEKIASMKKTKKIKLKEHPIHMGMFDFTVNVLVGDYTESVKYIAWKFEDEGLEDWQLKDKSYARGKCFYRDGYTPIVWIPKKPVTRREHATFAHECSHAVFRLFEWAGLDINEETEEVFNHALAHIIANVDFK